MTESQTEKDHTWGGLVEDPKNCAYCAAHPSLLCALHCPERTTR